jgi:hypothetical protein
VYRKRRHDNQHVAATDESLRRICSRWRADVDVKQRVADVLDIDALRLGDLRWYALSSHFDFVVWRDNEPQFAVEFDERHHFTDPEQIIKDEKKNAICEAALPLLRIEAASLKRVGGTPLVEWLAELFFVYHDLWLPARAGWDEDEGFNPDDWDDDLYREVRSQDEFSYIDFMAARRGSGVPEHSGRGPFDLFHDARRALAIRDAQTYVSVPSWFNTALGVNSYVETDPQGRAVGHVAVAVDESGVVIGTGRCWNPGAMFCGDPNLGTWIAVDLAGRQAADFLELYDRGKMPPLPWDQAERRLSGLDVGLFMTAVLDQHDYREISYQSLRKFGMDHDSALRAAYSMRWDDEGRLIDDDRRFDDDW